MIDHLHIENFKGWKDTGTIKLSPLTVFFGANSSGKSSIGQFLMLLKQSVESSDRKSVFFTGNEDTAVDLGLPTDLVFDRDWKNEIRFSYDWTPEKELILGDVVREKKFTVKHISFLGDVKIVEEESQEVEVREFNYSLKLTNGEQVEIGLRKKSMSNTTKRGYELLYKNYDFVRSRGRVWDITSIVRFYGFPDEAVAYYQNANFLQNINLVHEKLFSTIYYLGPLRKQAKRLYTWTGRRPEGVGNLGEDAIQAILAADNENRMINLKYKSPRKPFKAIVAEMLKKMSLIEDFKIEKISEKRQDYDVKVRTKGSKNWVDIPDVGMGVSQVLPVIVELFYAPPGSIIIMEQPELHLHPSAQAGLADVMIDAIHARENYGARGIQLIIETHSEYFLRRLQRRMAEGTLACDEFSAYFANNDEFPAKLEELQVDIFGNIENWPKNFFGDIAGDIYAQTDASLQRRISEEIHE
ncbi:MAG: DUF3696 domain-containing protein [Lachnospiraceae bacterium]|nr:DUF3696 domain-containing protein [Lachnospiraceae bacterium]